MILTRVSITDFGVFHGTQSFDLTPKKSRPIILFGGKNGAGKSSVLDAIRLCFYGPNALGVRSRDEYLAYLSSKIHVNPNALIQPQFASIKVEFQYGDMRSLHAYTVTRDWERRGTSSKVHETLTVEKDGKPLDEVSAEHWQDFVRDLIPPGLSQLFFFDGEKIQELAEDTTDQASLAQAIKSMLGLDIVESLQTDLAVHLSRVSKTLRHDREPQLADLEAKITELRQLAEESRAKKSAAEKRVSELNAEIQRIEQEISSEGGGLSKHREKFLQEESGCKARIEAYERSIRELCSGLLPFALVPELCLELQRQLVEEELQIRSRVGEEHFRRSAEEIVTKLPRLELWDEIGLDQSVRDKVIERLSSLLLVPQTPGDSEHAPIHNLSVGERDQLLSWIDQAVNNVPGVLSVTTVELERSYAMLRHASAELRKIPADDVLRPLLEKLNDLHHRLGPESQVLIELTEKLRSLDIEIANQERRYTDAVERITTEAANTVRIQLVPKIQKVLNDYKAALLVERVLKLQDAVTNCFNVLCRKKDSVARIVIDPKDFSITLYDRQGTALKKAALSAGEKQIYAISMLWGLAITSGRPLPVIIDTPLARLDSDHRWLLARNYFAVASHQVVILSTDTEVDRAYFEELRPAVAQSYHLMFDGDLGGTTAKKGYFWEEPHEANQVEADKRRVEPVAFSRG